MTVVIRGRADPAQKGRVVYALGGRELLMRHFVVRTTTPDNPFVPHRHQKEEIWFIVEGEGLFIDETGEHAVAAGDLIAIDSGALHGLRADGAVRWICAG
jgi:mannose-6-phosphate isomerase-like protein (cupin superfamily)